ncbi:hypothetical protein GEMRC1_001729 [Eukaryota sp. GEM-RC1]
MSNDLILSLSPNEADAAKEVWNTHTAGSPHMDVWQLRQALHALGRPASEEQFFAVIGDINDDGSGRITYSDFLQVIVNQKMALIRAEHDDDTLDSFIAVGGLPDKSGRVKTEKMQKILDQFGIFNMSIPELAAPWDITNSGELDYERYALMLASEK